MSHFAHINENNIVDNVIVAEQDFIDTGLLGDLTKWIQTSYNTRGGVYYLPNSNTPAEDQSKALRKNYAGIGFTYDSIRDAFVPEKSYESWILNEFTCIWEPPIPYPSDGLEYIWDESIIGWKLNQI